MTTAGATWRPSRSTTCGGWRRGRTCSTRRPGCGGRRGQDAAAAIALLDTAARPVSGAAWTGDAAESYQWHRGRLGRDLDTVARLCPATAARYEAMAALLRRGQDLLDDAWAASPRWCRTGAPATASRSARRTRPRPTRSGGPSPTRPPFGRRWCRRWSSRCRTSRFAAAMVGDRDAVGARSRRAAWRAGWPPAEPATGADVIAAGSVVVNTGGGNDVVTVRTEPDGSRIVLVDGVPVRVPAGARLVVRTGAGNDVVHVEGAGAVTVLGGTGDDTLDGGSATTRCWPARAPTRCAAATATTW